MAVINISVTAGAFTLARQFSLTDADAQRFLAAAKVNWPPRADDGSIIVSPTNADIARQWMRSLISYTKNAVRDYEGAAKPAPPDLPITEQP